MSAIIKFSTTRAETETIVKIVQRAKDMSPYPIDEFSLIMDISATHATDCPLKLDELLAADDIDFAHDVHGIELRSENFHALRSQYMNPYIKPGQESASYGVVVDDKLIGVFAFSASPTLANWGKHIDTPTMYLLSDFPVTPTKYKRLSKLVLYAALSKESKLLAERVANKRIRSLVTTAFSKNPVSMKYRGLFRLLNKKELPGVDEGETDMSKIYYNQGYQLS